MARNGISKTTLVGLGLIILAGALLLALSANHMIPGATTNQDSPTSVANMSASTTNQKPNWQSLPFVNVRTNQEMTLGDFAGKTIVVQVVSIWCANCLYQQKMSAEALTKLGDAAPVYISLDMDIAHPNDTAETIANHEDYKQFPWIFAFSNKTFTRALIDQFGYNVLNPPITPIFLISPNGTPSELYTDNRSAEQMIDLIQGASRLL